MITCHECASEVNETAKTCPECGYSAKSEVKKTGYFLLAGGFVAALTGIGLILAIPAWYFGVRCFKDANGTTVDFDAQAYSPW